MQRPQQRYYNYNKREPVIEDLREKLNRMRLEKSNDKDDNVTKLPPPDPAYNFLKDPLRGDSIQKNNPKKYNKINPHNRNDSKKQPQGVRELLKQPVNINVELSSESGERKCTLDKSKIVEISTIQKQYPKRPQFRRIPGELHTHYIEKKDAVLENSNRKENEPTLKDEEKHIKKKNVAFNCDDKNVDKYDTSKNDKTTAADDNLASKNDKW